MSNQQNDVFYEAKKEAEEETSLLTRIWRSIRLRCRFCGEKTWDYDDKKSYCYSCGKRQ